MPASAIDLEDVPERYRQAVTAALTAAGVADGHMALELVDAERIRELNDEFRGRDQATDVLAFPVDEDGPAAGPRELGDVVVCPGYCVDTIEAVVHGTLHLCGFDHERDDGEMLALQGRIMRELRDA